MASATTLETRLSQQIVAGKRGFDCRWGRQSTWHGLLGLARRFRDGPLLALERAAATIALDVHLEDNRMVDQSVDGRDEHGVIGKDFIPFSKWLIGGDQHGAPLVARADQLEQHTGLGMIFVDI